MTPQRRGEKALHNVGPGSTELCGGTGMDETGVNVCLQEAVALKGSNRIYVLMLQRSS